MGACCREEDTYGEEHALPTRTAGWQCRAGQPLTYPRAVDSSRRKQELVGGGCHAAQGTQTI